MADMEIGSLVRRNIQALVLVRADPAFKGVDLRGRVRAHHHRLDLLLDLEVGEGYGRQGLPVVAYDLED